MQGRPIRLAVAVTGAAELVLANEVVDELSDIDDISVGGLIPDGFGIERTPPILLAPGAGIPLAAAAGFTGGGG